MTFHTWGFIYLGTGSEDPATHRAVIANGGRVPVGGVTYGPESMHALTALFPQEATAGPRRGRR